MDDHPGSRCSIFDFASFQTRKDSIFSQLAQADIEVLLNVGECHDYDHGEPIFSMQDESTGLYCIVNGKVEILRVGRGEKEQVIRLATTGDIIGYRSLLSGERHQTSARAIEHSHVCHVPKDTFLALLARNAGSATRLMMLMASDLRHAEEKIVELAYHPVRERVAEVLLTLRDTYGYEEDQATINISMTRSELATVAGVAMETMSRQLQRMRREGIIDLIEHRIMILNDRELVRAANLDR